MNESFIHYLWQIQYFDKKNLFTTSNDPISILKAGTFNTDSGPDFLFAKIKIDGVEWVGNVEMHLKSSDWYAHRHETDEAYENVILHVVWEYDKPVYRKDKSVLQTIELKNRTNLFLLKEYKKLINSSTSVACEKSFSKVSSIIKTSMLDKTLMLRLEAKANQINHLLKLNKGSWEETAYQMLSKNFGFKVNADPFFQLSKALPYKTIKKQNNLLQVEALLFGQAGMLETKTKDEYISLLYREYRLLTQKFSLRDSRLNASQWRFLRMRPANFPTIRLAQLASLLSSTKNIFSLFIEADSYESLQKILSQEQSEYWKTHYRFGSKANGNVAELGESSIQNIIINTIAPLLVSYGKYKDEQRFVDRAIELLQEIPAEGNKIVRGWHDLELKAENAGDSQALIELFNNFCLKRQCLNCDIGASILRPKN